MAEKKTTQKVLSERALELVMLNVLGGLGGILLTPQEASQDCNKKSRGQKNRGQTGTTDSPGPDSTNLTAQQTDQKLN